MTEFPTMKSQVYIGFNYEAPKEASLKQNLKLT